jgi:DNA-binding transcriptional LysR family regulator
MDHFKQISAFVAVGIRRSLSAAARAEGVTPAIIGRRIDALEQRLGVKLLVRTTRKVSLTFDGTAFLEDCQRLLDDLANAEAAVSLAGASASGHLRISAPSGFGRLHVAPLLMRYLDSHPEVTAHLDLSDRLVDLVNESVDCAIRIGELADSSLVSVRLGEMRRVVVGSPAYFAQREPLETPAQLAEHNCFSLGPQRGWSFRIDEQTQTVKVGGSLECNDGAVLREWAMAGKGLTWRSLWEVGEDIAAGRLVTALDEYAAPPVGIHAVFPQRRQLPLRIRLFIELLRQNYSTPDYWTSGQITT